MTSRTQLIDQLIEIDHIHSGLSDATQLVCMSEVLRDACIRAGVPPEKIVVLGNRVSTARFHAAAQPDYNDGIIRALYVGRLVEQKNVHGVTAALAQLKQQGWQVQLDICGGIGINAYLRKCLAVLAPADWRYWGAVANRELPARYQAVDMYLGPSLLEGFQIPLIEALACGKPCVASHQPPSTEIISSETGELVDPTDPADMARGILRLKQRLNDPRTRAEMTRSCRERAEQRWSYQVISDRETEIYLNLLNSWSP